MVAHLFVYKGGNVEGIGVGEENSVLAEKRGRSNGGTKIARRLVGGFLMSFIVERFHLFSNVNL